ncbi:adenylate cyclase associated N terminal-domain-containing protein [Gorgonomyces haynaldii]|nr:adenylate cyclase associated N terminal-domain-containing protein [Gorgonomyces haynaldii]
MAEQLTAVLARLEAATARLEGFANKLSTPATGSAPATATGSDDKVAVQVKEFDALLEGEAFTSFVRLSTVVGGLVQEQAGLVKRAADATRQLIVTASQSKKPDQQKIVELIKPIQTLLEQIVSIKDKNRPSPLFSHLSCIADGIPAFGWVVVEPTPAPYIGEMKDAAQFYANKVIKEFKEKDKNHTEYVIKFIEFLGELFQYVKKHHTTGLQWNPRGGEAKQAAGPPPPPAPTAAQLEAFSDPKQAKPATNFVSELAGDVTSRLRKVDKSEMTHKNPELRATSVVPAAAAAAKPAAKAFAPPKQPPKIALEGNKWAIENHVDNQNIVVDQTELRHVVYVYNCQNSTISIKGKVNAITLDGCKKVGLLVDTVVSSVETVNCKSVQIQITGTAPTCSVDKTDGLQLYLSKSALDIEIYSAKSSELNVLVPDDKGEYNEMPVSEQFKTVVKGSKLVTEAVEHKE